MNKFLQTSAAFLIAFAVAETSSVHAKTVIRTEVITGPKHYSHLVRDSLNRQQKMTVRRKSGMVTMLCNPEYHTHYDARTIKTIHHYSDGSQRVVNERKHLLPRQRKLKSGKCVALGGRKLVTTQAVEGKKYYSHFDRIPQKPVITRIVENNIVITKTCVPEYHQHYDARDVSMIEVFSDGTRKTVSKIKKLYARKLSPLKPGNCTTKKETATPVVVKTITQTSEKYYSHLERIPQGSTNDISVKGNVRVIRTCYPEYHIHYDAVNITTFDVLNTGRRVVKNTTKKLLPRKRKLQPGKCVTRTEPYVANKSGGSRVVDTTVPVTGNVNKKDLGERTAGYNINPNYYHGKEFGKNLHTHGFDFAYSRGWTGKGSLVVIADSGADLNHPDLKGKVKYTRDYTGQDNISAHSWHGTHVAGIVAARRNSNGVHGSAYDADLAIAKVSSGYGFSFMNAIKAAEWGRSLGAVAINASAETRLDSNFRKMLVKDGNGNWHNTHWYYSVNGYNGAKDAARRWKRALGDEMVLVKAAGNAGTEYSAGMNQMATATENGKLILDGQMIIVGNYSGNNHYGNKAGNVCTTYQQGKCQDAAKIKDYYIMADGYNITSTRVGGGYTNLTGTSMSAPLVTGAIAVLHQMWPHMKGKNLVKLVLQTANKDVKNSWGKNIYDENIHGQGLLDMNRATQPVGATGIPTTGRTSGGISAVAGGARIAGINSGQLSALTNVMVLDSYERDFYLDLSGMVQDTDTRTASIAEQQGIQNYYAPYFDGNKHIDFATDLNKNTSMVVGTGFSSGHFLGNAMFGSLGTSKLSNTSYININYKKKGLFAQAGVGITNVNFDKKDSMMTNASAITSSTWTLGYELEPAKKHKWGFTVSQPVTIEHAKFNYRVPDSRTNEGKVNYKNSSLDMSSQKREIDFGTYYSFNTNSSLGIPVNVRMFGEVRTKAGQQQEGRIGLSASYKF